jgi:uncharacterized cupin superfamily protein
MRLGPVLLLLAFLIAGCGNVEWSNSFTINQPPPATLAAGQTVKLAPGDYILVPAGTTITTTRDVVTVYDHGSTVHTEPGAVVSAPPNATGTADILVTTRS